MAAKIRRNDQVQVLTGKDRGRRGPVRQVIPDKDRAVVTGINMIKRHMRPLVAVRSCGAEGGVRGARCQTTTSRSSFRGARSASPESIAPVQIGAAESPRPTNAFNNLDRGYGFRTCELRSQSGMTNEVLLVRPEAR